LVSVIVDLRYAAISAVDLTPAGAYQLLAAAMDEPHVEDAVWLEVYDRVVVGL